MKRILITGGAGFIGSHLAEALIEEGHRVVVVDNLALGTEKNIRHLQGNPRFRFHVGDVLEIPPLDKIFLDERFEVVFHMAANSDIAKSWGDPSIDLDNSFLTTYRVLDLMRRHATRDLIFPSSSAVYGALEGKIGEERGPLLPASHYGAAKLASEAFISSFVENYRIRAWIVRFPNVVGERATHGVVCDFIEKLRANPGELEILGDGEQCKPYVYVKDVVSGLLHIWHGADQPINVFNLGGNSRTRVRDIARMVAAEMGLHPALHFSGQGQGWIGDIPHYDYDLTKIHKLGWRAARTSDEAIALSIRRILQSAEGA